MEQKNIEIMDIVVSKMAEGTKLSKALRLVYTKRNVVIPFKKINTDAKLTDLNLSCRTTNTLLKAGMRTINDVIEYHNNYGLATVKGFARHSCTELFEKILDGAWANMDKTERTYFLIDTIERNTKYIRAEFR